MRCVMYGEQPRYGMLYGNILLMVVLSVMVFMLAMAIGPRPTYAVEFPPADVSQDDTKTVIQFPPVERQLPPRKPPNVVRKAQVVIEEPPIIERQLPPPKPLNMHWQCNDIRVTIVEGPAGVVYDLGGTVWGGSQFLFSRTGELFFNGRPCMLLMRR